MPRADIGEERKLCKDNVPQFKWIGEVFWRVTSEKTLKIDNNQSNIRIRQWRYCEKTCTKLDHEECNSKNPTYFIYLHGSHLNVSMECTCFSLPPILNAYSILNEGTCCYNYSTLK